MRLWSANPILQLAAVEVAYPAPTHGLKHTDRLASPAPVRLTMRSESPNSTRTRARPRGIGMSNRKPRTLGRCDARDGPMRRDRTSKWNSAMVLRDSPQATAPSAGCRSARRFTFGRRNTGWRRKNDESPPTSANPTPLGSQRIWLGCFQRLSHAGLDVHLRDGFRSLTDDLSSPIHHDSRLDVGSVAGVLRREIASISRIIEDVRPRHCSSPLFQGGFSLDVSASRGQLTYLRSSHRMRGPLGPRMASNAVSPSDGSGLPHDGPMSLSR